MYIKNINITNFRCYLSQKYSFNQGINIFVGNNATGKTSAAEAIGYLIIGKSFKNSKESEVVNDKCGYFSLVGDVDSDGKQNKIVLYEDSNGKKISKNGKPYLKISDFVGEIGLVSFSPDDLKLIKGSPIERRRFLDLSICQIDKEYLIYLSKYTKLLKERNEYLKTIDEISVNTQFLDVIDEQLIDFGKKISLKRNSFVSGIIDEANKIMKQISNDTDSFVIEYIPKLNINNYDKEFYNRRNHDIFSQTTTGGPHRDDVKMIINDKNASDCGSQGQIRTAVLSLKLAYYKELLKNNKPVIIIFDDVLSELDENRQNKVLEMLKDFNQIFITCTNINLLTKNVIDNSNIIHVGKE